MSGERTIGIRLVIDDQGSARLKTFVQEVKRELAEVVAQAAAAEKAVSGLGAATEKTAGAPQRLAQGFRDLDGDIARALEQGVKRFSNLEDAIHHAHVSQDALSQATARSADAHVQAYQRSNQAVNNLSGAVDKMLSQQSRWNAPLKDVLGLGSAWEKAGTLARKAGDLAAQGAKTIWDGTKKAWEGAKQLGSEISDLTSKIFNLKNAAIGLATVWLFNQAVSPGLKFNESIESAQLGIASLITSTMELRDHTGQLLPLEAKYAEAKRVSAHETDQLRIAGLATVATTEQLVEAYQQAVGPLTRAGVQLEDVRRLTIGIVQAAGALGMPMFQINEEVRSIAEGTVNVHSRVAKTLGITNEQLGAWRASNTLVDELNKRLEAFNIAGIEAMETWRGIKSNMTDALGYLMGKATEPLFEALKTGWQALLGQVFDIDLAKGKFSISQSFMPTINSLREMFAGIGGLVEEALRAVPEKIAAATKWWQEHGESVKAIASNAYGAVKSVVEGSLTVIEKALNLLVPESGRMKEAEAGFKGIAGSIGDIADHLAKIPSTVWTTLAAAGMGKWVAGPMGAAAAADQTLKRSIDRPEWMPEEWAEGLNWTPLPVKWGFTKISDWWVRREMADWQAKAGSIMGPPAPGSQEWLDLVLASAGTTSTPEVGGVGWRGWQLSAKGDPYSQAQKDKIEDLTNWTKGKLAELSGLEADRLGDLPGKVQAEWEKALTDIDKKLADMKQAGLSRTDEYKRASEVKAQINAYYSAKELEAEAEKNARLKQYQYETGQATRAQLIESLEDQLEVMAQGNRTQSDEYRQLQKRITELRLGGLQEEETILLKKVDLHQASKQDLVDLYRRQQKEITENAKLSEEQKAKLVLDIDKKLYQAQLADYTEYSQQWTALKFKEVDFSNKTERSKAVEKLHILTTALQDEKRLIDAYLNWQKAALHYDLVSGWEAAWQEITLTQKSYQEQQYQIATATYGAMHEAFRDTFMLPVRALFEGELKNFADLLNAFGDILKNALKRWATAWADYFADVAMQWVMSGLGGYLGFATRPATASSAAFSRAGQASGGFSVGLGDAASLGTAAWNWWNNPAATATLNPSQALWLNGSGGYLAGASPAATNAIYAGGEWAGVSPSAWGGGGWWTQPSYGGMTWGGTTLAGVGGALGGWMMNQGKGTTAQLVGAAGGAAGSIGGSMLATMALAATPLAPIAPFLGALVGGGAGGMLGGLFGEETNDAPKWYQENLRKLTQGGSDEGTWLDLIRQHTLGGGGTEQELKDLYQSLRGQGRLEWWQPDPGQVLKTGSYDQDYWKVAGLGGQKDGQGLETLASEGGLLGSGEWKALAEAIAEAETALGPFKGALDGALEGLDLTKLSADELSTILRERLSPATAIQNQLNSDLAAGVDNLSAHQKALQGTIEGLLYTQDLDAQSKQGLIDLLLTESGNVEELLGKKQRLDEITRQLAGAHQLGAEKTKALIEEGRELAKDLGLQKTKWEDNEQAVSKIVDAVQRLIDKLDSMPSSKDVTVNYRERHLTDDSNSYHSGGVVLHKGGLAGKAVSEGLISLSGGSLPRRHTGGDAPWYPSLKNNEVLAILERMEYVVRKESINAATLPVLRYINSTGKLPALTTPVILPVVQPQASQTQDAWRRQEAQESPVIQINAPLVSVDGGVFTSGEALNDLARLLEAKLYDLTRGRYSADSPLVRR